MDLRPPHPMMEHPPHLMDISQQHNAQHQSMLVNIKPEPSHHEKFDNGMSMGPHSSMGHHSLPYSTPQQPPHSNPPPHPAHQTPQHPQQPSDNNKSGPQISSTTGNTPPQHPGQHSPLGPDGSNGTMDNNKQQDKNSGIPPKKRPHSVPETQKDNIYWDKRRKNNESAKRSRDARRMKEEQIAMRVVYLEQENLQLRTEVSLLKSEIEKLRCMLYNSWYEWKGG